MILRDQVERRVSAPGLLAAALLAALAVPSWTLAAPSAEEDVQVTVVKTADEPVVAQVRSIVTRVEPIVARVEPRLTAVVAFSQRADDEDDDDDEKAGDKAPATAKDNEKAAKLKAERDQLRTRSQALDKEMASSPAPTPTSSRSWKPWARRWS